MDNVKSVSEAKCFLRRFPLFQGYFRMVREKLFLLFFFFLLVTPYALLMVLLGDLTNERKHANQQGLSWWLSLCSSKCFSASVLR